MNNERMHELRGDLNELIKEELLAKAHAAELLAIQTIEKMADEGKCIELTEDEDRLLVAYRNFKTKNASGVFSWKYEQDDKSIIIPETPCLIQDPRDLSQTPPENSVDPQIHRII